MDFSGFVISRLLVPHGSLWAEFLAEDRQERVWNWRARLSRWSSFGTTYLMLSAWTAIPVQCQLRQYLQRTAGKRPSSWILELWLGILASSADGEIIET